MIEPQGRWSWRRARAAVTTSRPSWHPSCRPSPKISRCKPRCWCEVVNGDLTHGADLGNGATEKQTKGEIKIAAIPSSSSGSKPLPVGLDWIGLDWIDIKSCSIPSAWASPPPAYLAAGQRAGGTRSSGPVPRILPSACSRAISSPTTTASMNSAAATSTPGKASLIRSCGSGGRRASDLTNELQRHQDRLARTKAGAARASNPPGVEQAEPHGMEPPDLEPLAADEMP